MMHVTPQLVAVRKWLKWQRNNCAEKNPVEKDGKNRAWTIGRENRSLTRILKGCIEKGLLTWRELHSKRSIEHSKQTKTFGSKLFDVGTDWWFFIPSWSSQNDPPKKGFKVDWVSLKWTTENYTKERTPAQQIAFLHNTTMQFFLAPTNVYILHTFFACTYLKRSVLSNSISSHKRHLLFCDHYNWLAVVLRQLVGGGGLAPCGMSFVLLTREGTSRPIVFVENEDQT